MHVNTCWHLGACRSFPDGYFNIHIQGNQATVEPIKSKTGQTALAKIGYFRLSNAE